MSDPIPRLRTSSSSEEESRSWTWYHVDDLVGESYLVEFLGPVHR